MNNSKLAKDFNSFFGKAAQMKIDGDTIRITISGQTIYIRWGRVVGVESRPKNI